MGILLFFFVGGIAGLWFSLPGSIIDPKIAIIFWGIIGGYIGLTINKGETK